MAIDGGLTSKTALLSWPYKGESEPRDVTLRLDLEKLDEWVKYAHNSGWSVGIHVVGDISQQKAVEANIIAALQPAFIYGEAAGYDELLPKDKIREFTPVKTYLENGIVTAISTDMPSAHFSPFYNLYSAVTRKGALGDKCGDKECISIHQAIKMMTYNGACLTGEENIKGSIEIGKLADLVVLDCSLECLKHEELKDIEVKMTISDGKIIYIK